MTASDEAKKVLEGVTPGPWKTGQSSWNDEGDVQYVLHGIKHAGYADCMFIAWAREGVPALLAEIAAKDAALTAAMDALNELARHPEDEGHSMPGDFRDYYRDACKFAKQKVEEISAMKGDTHE